MSKSLTFDDILDKKLKLGKYQYIALGFLCLVDFNDGVELLSMSIIMPIIKLEWNISNFWIEVLSSIFYLGMLFGALITGKIADKSGRRNTIIYASIIQFFIGVSFSLINNLFLLLLVRFLYGFCYGFSLPLTITMISEITPLEFRGKLIIITNFCVSIGKVYGTTLAYFVLTDLHSGNWRLLMILCSLTSLIVVYGVIFHVHDSPRFLLSVGKSEEAFEIIDKIGLMNHKEAYEKLTEDEKEGLRNFNLNNFVKEEQASPTALFNEKNLPYTIRVWIIWFVLILVEFGQYVILPFILIQSKGSFGTLILAIAGELPSIAFSLYVVDKENFGRKKTLSYCLFTVALINLGCYYITKDYIGILISLERFFMKNGFSMLIPLTSELYPTNYRTIGYGYATGAGRVAATLSPYVLLPLFYYDTYSPFLLFFVLGIVSFVSCYTIPKDRTGKYLDVALELDDLSGKSKTFIAH